MTGALSMIMIDQTVVSLALATMQRDLGLTSAGPQWVVNANLLVLAVLVALGPLLTQGVSWRPVFYVNLPIGLLMIAAAHFTLPRRPRPPIPADAID